MEPLKAVKLIVIHCADTKISMNVTVSDLHQWHVVENGWDEIGYHYYIKFDGTVHNCRDTQYAGAHCKSVNDISLAICLEGGYGGGDNFTDLQKESLSYLINKIKADHPNAAVIGHNSIDDKACPSFDVVKWYEDNVELSGLINAMGGLHE